jgi:hypothetical protein
MLLFISDISHILFQQGCQMSPLLIILFQQRCQAFGRNRDLGPQHRVSSDDDPASRGHAADQDDADHLPLFCGEPFQLMFVQMELTFLLILCLVLYYVVIW